MISKTEAQKLLEKMMVFADAYKSGNPVLIQFGQQQINEVLNDLVEPDVTPSNPPDHSA
jgi:hypothetical protein